MTSSRALQKPQANKLRISVPRVLHQPENYVRKCTIFYSDQQIASSGARYFTAANKLRRREPDILQRPVNYIIQGSAFSTSQ
jgi:hypothetical protein